VGEAEADAVSLDEVSSEHIECPKERFYVHFRRSLTELRTPIAARIGVRFSSVVCLDSSLVKEESDSLAYGKAMFSSSWAAKEVTAVRVMPNG
jgi:hypothetical protein